MEGSGKFDQLWMSRLNCVWLFIYGLIMSLIKWDNRMAVIFVLVLRLIVFISLCI